MTLLELDKSSEDPEIAVAWEQEIRARIEATEDGTTLGTAYEDVMSEVRIAWAHENQISR